VLQRSLHARGKPFFLFLQKLKHLRNFQKLLTISILQQQPKKLHRKYHRGGDYMDLDNLKEEENLNDDVDNDEATLGRPLINYQRGEYDEEEQEEEMSADEQNRTLTDSEETLRRGRSYTANGLKLTHEPNSTTIQM
jgi:hypothetical protein